VATGATKDEILGTVSVAIAMGGTAIDIEKCRVVKVREGLGKWL